MLSKYKEVEDESIKHQIHEECRYVKELGEEIFADDKHRFCAEIDKIFEGDVVCKNHAGGPAIVDGKLAGVVSYIDSIDKRFPIVYTEIVPYKDWIKNATAASDYPVH